MCKSPQLQLATVNLSKQKSQSNFNNFKLFISFGPDSRTFCRQTTSTKQALRCERNKRKEINNRWEGEREMLSRTHV